MADSKKFQITLSDSMMKKLEDSCYRKGLKKSAIVTLALSEFFERQKKLDEMEAKRR